MRNIKLKKVLSLLLTVVLIVAMALVFSGCGNSEVTSEAISSETASSAEVTSTADTKEFKFIVIDADNNETDFDITTDDETVGDALLDEGLIEGEDSDYGLYVKTVNGITADYDTDGSYWAFYINDEYASTGVDSTNVEDGAVYTFKIEK